MAIIIQWFGHASFCIRNGSVIYIDPWKRKDTPKDGSVILVSHGHYDHFSQTDIDRVASSQASILSTPDVIEKLGKGQVIRPGQTISLPDCTVTAVAAYNPAKKFHPQENQWVGFIIALEGKRIYYSGDTDMTPEMKALTRIDAALLPIGGTYTLNPQEAAEALTHIKPDVALPYHWGDIVGSRSDADIFAECAPCPVTILTPGQSITL